jgi:hypothetical protein
MLYLKMQRKLNPCPNLFGTGFRSGSDDSKFGEKGFKGV